MKHVILIGDSIRMGYQAAAIDALADIANVWTPEENGRHSANLLEKLDDWILQRDCDVVHLNAGLHDLVLMNAGEGPHQIPLDDYEQNLDELVAQVKNKPGRKLILATTTPVSARKQQASGKAASIRRDEHDVPAYNNAMRRVAAKHDVQVNDLYKFVMDRGGEDFLGSDGVHFPPESSRQLGEHVAKVVRNAL